MVMIVLQKAREEEDEICFCLVSFSVNNTLKYLFISLHNTLTARLLEDVASGG